MIASTELDPRIEAELRAVLREMAPAAVPATLERATLGAAPIWRTSARSRSIMALRLSTAIALLALAALVAAIWAVGAAPPKPTVSIYLVDYSTNVGDALVRVGIRSDEGAADDPGTEVAWVRIEPGTYQEVPGIPAGARVVALMVHPDCTVWMERPWSWSDLNGPDAPANEPFYVGGPATGSGGVELGGWGLPNQLSEVKAEYREAALNRVPNPCADKSLVAAGPGVISDPLTEATHTVQAYSGALGRGDYSAAWAMLGPEDQARYGSLESFTADRSAYVDAHRAGSFSVGNAPDQSAIAALMMSRYGDTGIDLTNAVLIDVSYPDMPPPRTSDQYVVVQTANGTLIYEVAPPGQAPLVGGRH